MAEGEWYDTRLKENAVRLVQSGMPAAKVAREFGLPSRTVTKWIRLALGPNYQPPKKKWVVDKSRCKVKGKFYIYKGSFTAYDKYKNPYVILIFQSEVGSSTLTEEANSIPSELFMTEKRQPVQRIRKALYKLKSGFSLECFDPDAP